METVRRWVEGPEKETHESSHEAAGGVAQGEGRCATVEQRFLSEYGEGSRTRREAHPHLGFDYEEADLAEQAVRCQVMVSGFTPIR